MLHWIHMNILKGKGEDFSVRSVHLYSMVLISGSRPREPRWPKTFSVIM